MKSIRAHLLIAVILFCWCYSAKAQEPAAKEIMQKNFSASRIADYTMMNRLTLFNPAGQTRTRVTKAFFKLQKNGVDYYRIVRFLEPADVKGTGMLTLEHAGGDDDVWIYLPALKKSRRIASSEKSSSFMGTEFSYADILTAKIEDYTYKMLRSEQLNGVDCFVVESIPVSSKIEDETGYSKKISWIRKDNYVEQKIEYFDKVIEHIKTLITDNINEVDPAAHKWMVLKREMINHQTKRKTLMEVNDVKVNTGLKDNQFTIKYLER
jgi:outer membrane lipoprotein-sorting protein